MPIINAGAESMSPQPPVPTAMPEQLVPHPDGQGLHPTTGASSNDVDLPDSPHLPPAQRGRHLPRFVIPTLVLLFLAAGTGVWFAFFRGAAVRADLVTTRVEYRDIQVKIPERGTLE